MRVTYVCPVCGLDYDSISPSDGIVALRTFPRRYRAALAAAMEDETDDGIVRRRPEPEVWSALEYVGHVIDIFEAHTSYVREMRTKTRPTLPDPQTTHFDEIANGGGSIEAAMSHLTSAVDALVAELEKVDGSEWNREAEFSWGERDLLSTMRNPVHEGSHHLRDVEKVLDQVRSR